MNSCMWATAHLSKEGDQFQRVLRNTDVETIEKVLTTVHNPIQVLREEELYGLSDQLDWTESSQKSYYFLEHCISRAITVESVRFSPIRYYIWVGKMSTPSLFRRNMGTGWDCLVCLFSSWGVCLHNTIMPQSCVDTCTVITCGFCALTRTCSC